jgi:putative heme-binding domain-containing protein
MQMVVLLALGALAVPAQEKREEVKLPTSAEDIETGRKLYMGGCTYCHGPTGDGGKGADLARPELPRAKTDVDLVRIIENGIPGTEMPGAGHMTLREVTQTAAFVRTLGKVDAKPVPGSPQAGRAQYTKHGCAACHTTKQGHGYEGGLTGPDLSAIGARRNASYLREALVAPEASVPEWFRFVKVVTKDGKTLTGRRVNEDTFTLVMRDFNGANYSFLKSSLRDFTWDRKKSPMPSYKDKLSSSELDDLVAYLVSLREAE